MCSGFSRSSFPVAAAAPKVPICQVLDIPVILGLASRESPNRAIISTPPATAAIKSLPSIPPTHSATAKQEGTTVIALWSTAFSCTSSMSRARAIVAFIKTALGTGTLSPRTMILLSGRPPHSLTTPVRVSIPGALEPATALATVSRITLFVESITSSGKSSKLKSVTYSASSWAISIQIPPVSRSTYLASIGCLSRTKRACFSVPSSKFLILLWTLRRLTHVHTESYGKISIPRF